MLKLINISAQAGISSYLAPIEECSDLGLNLDALLIDDPIGTYIGIADGESMTDLGIYSGDLLIISRETRAIDKDIIVADLNGVFVCKQVDKKNGILLPAAKGFKPYTLKAGDHFQVEGVVVRSIRLHRPIANAQYA